MFKIKFSATGVLKDKLPSSRKKQFVDIISNQYFDFIKIGFVLFLFAIPFFACSIIHPFVLQRVVNSLAVDGASDAAIQSSKNVANVLFSAAKVLCLMIFFIGLAGVGRYNKETAFGNGVLFGFDFFKGIKQNVKNYLITSFLFGFLLFLVRIASNELAVYLKTNSLILLGIISGVVFLLLLPVNMFMLASATIYDLPFFHNFVNSIRFSIKNIWLTILFALLLIGLYYLQFITYIFIQLTIYAIVVVFVLPIYLLGWHLFALSKFDIYLNKEHYQEIYLKGLFIKEIADEKEKSN